MASSVNSMVAYDEKDRPDFQELHDNMPSYQEIKPFLDDRLQNPNVNQP